MAVYKIFCYIFSIKYFEFKRGTTSTCTAFWEVTYMLSRNLVMSLWLQLASELILETLFIAVISLANSAWLRDEN